MSGFTLAAGVILAVSPVAVSAQDYQYVTASGRIRDDKGLPVTGATVTFRSQAQGFVRSAQTDRQGNYRIAQLPQGAYTVEVTADAFRTLTQTDVQLSQDQSTNEFTLASALTDTTPGAKPEPGAIVVTGSRTRTVDFNRTTTGAAINVTELAKRIPVARDLTSVIRLAPGTLQGDGAFGNLASITGSSVSENQFFINGLNVTNYRQGLGSTTVPFEFYETTDVKNGGYPAEFGRATGGFVAATTKSGSNTLHAGVVATWQPDELRSTSPNTYNENNKDAYRETREAYFFVSGPAIKNRLFFYGFYQARNREEGDGHIYSNLYESYRDHVPYWGGKIDGIIADGHRAEFTYFNTEGRRYTNNYQYDPTTGQKSSLRSGTNDGRGGANYVGRYTGAFASWLTVSGAYGRYHDQDVNRSSLSIPYISDVRSGRSRLIGNPDSLLRAAYDSREFYRADADIYFKLLGSHHIRGGYDRENLRTDITDSYTSGIAYTYYRAAANNRYAPAGTEYVRGRTRRNGGIFKTSNEAFYIEDNWSLLNQRLNLQLGVRNDRFVNRNVEGKPFYQSGDQWGPRLGATFDPFGDQRTKLYATFGRYYLPIVANTNFRLAGAELDYNRFWMLNGVNADNTPQLGDPLTFAGAVSTCPGSSAANCSLVQNGTAKPTDATVSKSLKPQSVDEIILGAERRFGDHLRLGIYGTYRKLNASLEDAAIDQAVLKYCSREKISGCDDIWTGFNQYVLINPGEAARITLNDPVNGEKTLRTVDFSAADLGYPRAKRTYSAITFKLDRDFDGKWELHANYTWSKTRGNIEGGVKSDNGQSDSGLTTDFDQPGLTNGAYGYLPTDARHNIKIYGYYQLTHRLGFGANFYALSPRRFGCIGVVPDSVDPFANVYGASGNYCPLKNGQVADGNPVVLVPRGSITQSDWQTSTDLTVTYRPNPDNPNLAFEVAAFNVFNQKAVTKINEYGTDGGGTALKTYRLPTDYQTPRYVRFQMRIGF